jgi:hypothetical protein
MTALYGTEPVLILGTRWRYAIDSKGYGDYQYADARNWLPFAVYNHKRQGLMTLAELRAALYTPNRAAIEAARQAINTTPDFQLRPTPSAMQFNLI